MTWAAAGKVEEDDDEQTELSTRAQLTSPRTIVDDGELIVDGRGDGEVHRGNTSVLIAHASLGPAHASPPPSPMVLRERQRRRDAAIDKLWEAVEVPLIFVCIYLYYYVLLCLACFLLLLLCT